MAGLVVVLLIATSCSSGPFQRDLGQVAMAEDLEVERGDRWTPLAAGDGFSDGSVLRTGEADARLEVGQAQVWLGPGTVATLTDAGVDVQRGDVLVQDPAATLTATWDDVTVSGQATYRIRTGAAPRVGVYEGTATVDRIGERRDVEQLREVGLAVRRLLNGSPLRYHGEDVWDRVLLAGALAFDAETDRLRRGIERRYGTEPREPEFYESFSAVAPEALPVLARSARSVLSDDRFGPPSDVLVTLFVAQAAARDGSTEAVTDRINALRRTGAKWGLIAAELAITSTQLAAIVDLSEERQLTLGPVDPAPPPPPPDTDSGPAAPADLEAPAPAAPGSGGTATSAGAAGGSGPGSGSSAGGSSGGTDGPGKDDPGSGTPLEPEAPEPPVAVPTPPPPPPAPSEPPKTSPVEQAVQDAVDAARDALGDDLP